MKIKRVIIAGFHPDISTCLDIDDYNVIDANSVIQNIEDFDNGHIDLKRIPDQFDFGNLTIDQYWRMKGEFDHYTNRRALKYGHDEQDRLFRTILHRVIKLCHHADGIILSNLPHQGVDSILSNYAKMQNIPVVYFTPSIFKNYSYLLGKERDFCNLIQVAHEQQPLLNLNFDNTSKQELYYMQSIYYPKRNRISRKFKTFYKLYKIGKIVPFRILAEKIWNYWLHSGYRSIEWTETVEFNDEHLNIYMPLHLQPELTTSNMGELFYDQNYAISRIIQQCEASSINYSIYLKENPKQDETHRVFLDQFKPNNNIQFVSAEYPSDFLIDNCDIVCTVSGTAGWEAIKSGKPCLILGRTWYETAPGILKDVENIDMEIKTQEVDLNAVKNWFLEHQRCLHLLQNDTTIPDMASLVSESRQTLKSVIELVF